MSKRRGSIEFRRLRTKAIELWDLQRRLQKATTELSEWIGEDDSLARTLGNDGEYIESETADFAKKIRTVCLRLDREIAPLIAQENRR